jgi:hypothetical protein
MPSGSLSKQIASAFALFVIGVAGVWFVTRAPGPALSPDSASYLFAAESLSRGHGLRVPFAECGSVESTDRLSHFPPGFPSLIALPAMFGVAPVQAARVIEALAGGVVLAVAALAASAASGSATGGVLAGGMILFTPAIVQVFVPVLSEPVFLCLVALLVHTLVRRPDRPLAAGTIAAAGALVRYVGLSLGVTAVIFSFALPGRFSDRVRRAVLAGLPTVLAVSAWRRYSGHFREYGLFTKGLGATAEQAWNTVAEWLTPSLPGGPLRSLIAAGVLAGAAIVIRRALRLPPEDRPVEASFRRLGAASALFSISFFGVWGASRLFADPDLELDWRTWSPVFLVAEVVFAAALARRLRARATQGRTTMESLLSLAVLGLWALGSGAAVVKLVTDVRRNGYGYENAAWQASALAGWLRTEGANRELYSNHPAAIWHVTHRSSRLLPRRSDPSAVQELAKALDRAPSAIVTFGNAFENTLDPRTVARELGLVSPRTFDRGTVWVHRVAGDR